MTAPERAEAAYQKLRLLAAEQPREARLFVARLIDEKSPDFAALLERISAPGEGRLRQLVANAVRIRGDRAALVPVLRDWLKFETDEFTKHALQSALDGQEEQTRPVEPRLADRASVEAFRYAAKRLSHRVSNSLAEPQTALLRLSRFVAEVADERSRNDLSVAIARLRIGLEAVSRIVAFDTEDSYFQVRNIVVLDWLKTMNADYATKYAAIELTIHGDPGTETARVRANNHLLETVFWNLWTNAQQAVEACKITVRAAIEGRFLRLLIGDNGDGFPMDMKDVAFVDRFSKKGKDRGTGLLEVQDAVEQLRGNACLFEDAGKLRVRISLPIDAP